MSACGGSTKTNILGAGGLIQPFGVVSAEPHATLVGRDILAAGGSAADAAAAMALVMAVTLPSRAGLGGGGVCELYNPPKDARAGNGTTVTIDFLSRDKGAAPGFLAGIAAMQARYGHLRWEQIVVPAETLARESATVSRALAHDLAAYGQAFAADPEARRLFARPDGSMLAEGDPMVQPQLASTLAAIRQRGVDAVRSGPLADRMAAAFALDSAALRRPQVALRDSVAVPFAHDMLYFADLTDTGTAAAWNAVADLGDEARAAALAKAPASQPAAPPTTALAVVDGFEQGVSCVLSAGGPFGSGRMAQGLGFFIGRATGAAGVGGPVIEVNHNVGRLHFAGAGAANAPTDHADTALVAEMAHDLLEAPARSVSGATEIIDCHREDGKNLKLCQAMTDKQGFGLGVLGH